MDRRRVRIYRARKCPRVETVFGASDVGRGDYVMILRATTHRVVAEARERGHRRRVSRAPGAIGRPTAIPRRPHICRATGQLLEHAPHCERGPARPGRPAPGRGHRRRSRRGDRSPHQAPRTGTGRDRGEHLYAPFHVPRCGRLGRLPLPMSSTSATRADHRAACTSAAGASGLEGWNFVICNFVRAGRLPPLSIPVPLLPPECRPDEVMFYVDGDYEARKGSGSAWARSRCIPAATPTAPQPGRWSARIGVEYFDELAVMVDTFRPPRAR